MKKIVYWAPVLSKIATLKAVINSAESLKKYSSNYDVTIINTVGEYDEIKNNKHGIKIVNFFNDKSRYPGIGFWKTRISLIRLFFKNFYKLKKFLDESQPDFLLIHLMTSLPMILLILFNFRTKFVLRISGFPKLNIIRYLLWKLALKNFFYIISPTKKTSEYLIKLKLIDKKKIVTIYDPIIKLKKLKKNDIEFSDYFISVGRLTKQKNIFLLLDAFKDLYKEELINEKLIIIGDGELKNKIYKYININNLNNKILLLGYKKNVFDYLVKAKAFVLTSLWEDPGFVLIEAAYCRASIISSDCMSGPIEFLENKNNGFLFNSNSKIDLKKKILDFKKSDQKEILIKKINALKEVKKFTSFRHFKDLSNLLK